MGLASDRDVIELVRRARAAIHSPRYEIEVLREMTALIDAYDSATAGGAQVHHPESASPAVTAESEAPAQPPVEAVFAQLVELGDDKREDQSGTVAVFAVTWRDAQRLAPLLYRDCSIVAFGGKAGA
jgi:hypothetical protein